MVNSIGTLINDLVRAIPHIVAALLVLLVGYIVARALRRLTVRLLEKAGMDRYVAESPAGAMVGRVLSSPARGIGTLVYWLVWLGVIALAVSVLGISALTGIMAAVYAYLPNVLAAVLILLGAVAVSALVTNLVNRLMGATPTGKLVASITPGVVFSIAIFMVLDQLGIAPAIVVITYAAILGSVALGAALAFGLGGRDAAAQMIAQAQMRAREQVTQARQDMAVARERQRIAQEQRDGRVAEGPVRGAGVASAPAFGESVESFDQADRRTGRRSRRGQVRDTRRADRMPEDSTIQDVLPPEDDI